VKKILQVVFAVVLFAQGPERPFRGVTHVARGQMHVVTVDLSTPGLRFKLTPPGGTRETLRQTTLKFLEQEHAQIAINGHFFLPFPSTDLNADLIGLAASEGKVISKCEQPVQSYAIVANAPAINIDQRNRATIVGCDAMPAGLWNTLAGSAQIVTNGVVTIPRYGTGQLTPNADYSNQRSWYDLPRARTAIGITRDGGKLVLFTVEAGMTVSEIASLLVKDYGVYNALNLDGGGSTSLAIDGKLVTSGNREVASSLAVFVGR
jgi:exopolysaccharide biosynthesis protein